MKDTKYKAIVIGSSTGGLRALEQILGRLPKHFSLPILIVQHREPTSPELIPKILGAKCAIRIKDAEDKETIEPGTAYFAPPNYHILTEPEGWLSLSGDEKENHSRPSIDVLFESAADAYGDTLIGVILTGASEDGAKGLEKIKAKGGIAIVQDPNTAESRIMPDAAFRRNKVDHILRLEEIATFFAEYAGGKEGGFHE